jgi:hypothetical protein
MESCDILFIALNSEHTNIIQFHNKLNQSNLQGCDNAINGKSSTELFEYALQWNFWKPASTWTKKIWRFRGVAGFVRPVLQRIVKQGL